MISESGFGRFDAPPIARMEQAGAAWATAQGVTGDDAKALAALRALPASALTLGHPGLLAVPRPQSAFSN